MLREIPISFFDSEREGNWQPRIRCNDAVHGKLIEIIQYRDFNYVLMEGARSCQQFPASASYY